MAFGDFRYPEVVQQFGLTWQTVDDLFGGVAGVSVTPAFQDALQTGALLAATVNTEKARSEWMIAPILVEF